MAAQLSTVHYLIAIASGSLSALAWHGALKRNRRILGTASALFFLVALLGKEFAAPLPVVLLSLPVRDLWSRWRHTIGHWIVLGIYLFWRRAVLGTLVGGYGWAVEPSEWPRLILMLPWKLILQAAGSHAVAGVVLIGAMIVAIAVGIRSRHAWASLLLAIVLAAAPYVPLAKEVHRRYAVVPWLTASIAFACSASAMRGRRFRAALLIGLPLLTILANRWEWSREYRDRLRRSDEGRFFVFDMPPGSLMRTPAPTASEMRDLSWLRTEYLGRSEGGTCFYDDIFLCTNDVRGKTVWQYDIARRAVVDATALMPEIASRHCSTIRMSGPLFARFWYRDSTLHWELGPYRDGHYLAVIGNGLQSGEIFRHNALHMQGGVTAVTYASVTILRWAGRPIHPS